MIRRITVSIWLIIVAGFCVLCAATICGAVSTRQFLLDDAESLSAGELKGTAVSSNGVVTVGVGTRRHGMTGVASAYCLARAADKSVMIGTGNSGKIYRYRGGELSVFAETGQLLVASLAFAEAGKLYAGTLPKGKIFEIDPQGKVREFAKPEGAEHIWALAYDPKRKVLFAATGPKGKIFALDPRGKAELYYDSDAAHVMALALDADGTLYAGTSDQALLLRIKGPGRAEVLQDLPGNEVTALAVRNGDVAATANEFPKPTAAAVSTTTTTTAVKPQDKPESKPGSQPEKTEKTESTAGTPPTPPSKISQPGTGQLWLVRKDGRAEMLFKSDKGHLTSVQWADDNILYAGSGRDGRVYRVQTDGTNAVWIDVDERMVLDIDFTGDPPLLTTGDTAALYEVTPAPPSEALWTSKSLDAQFYSRWGRLTWRGRGPVSFQTRSGNAEKPDPSWSDWSQPSAEPGPIRSPAGRFLQIRGRFGPDPSAVLYAVTAFYLPLNQRMTVRDIAAKPRLQPAPKPAGAAGAKSSDKKPEKPTGIYELSWKVDNPDGDQLRYRLQYRAEAQQLWRPMIRQCEPLSEEKYEWDAGGVPDGYYRIRVEASDELANPRDKTIRAAAESEPVLIDNHPPEVVNLKYADRSVQGAARDSQGPIANLEYAIDGGEWAMFFPDDELFDQAEERFKLKLDEIAPGSHIVAIRAADSVGNSASAEITVAIPGKK